MNARTNPHHGSSFDDFLIEEGMFEEVQAAAIKKVLAAALERYMSEHSISKTAMAKKIHSSRAFLDKVLDESNTSITLATMCRVASAMGKRINFGFENGDSRECLAS